MCGLRRQVTKNLAAPTQRIARYFCDKTFAKYFKKSHSLRLLRYLALPSTYFTYSSFYKFEIFRKSWTITTTTSALSVFILWQFIPVPYAGEITKLHKLGLLSPWHDSRCLTVSNLLFAPLMYWTIKSLTYLIRLAKMLIKH